jgi:signal transduction histidine kinase
MLSLTRGRRRVAHPARTITMTLLHRTSARTDRPRLLRRTVRLRLTLLYGGLFLLSGIALLIATYLLVREATGDLTLVRIQRLPEPGGAGAAPDGAGLEQFRAQSDALRAQATAQRTEQLRQLLIQSGVALAVMTVVSVGLGWLMAGRALRPVREMTRTTRLISQHNLHERLALDGPRDELTELGDTIDELLERLETAFDAQRLFVANASHELRTPLTMMRTSLDVAAAKPGGPSAELATLDAKLREGLTRADGLLEGFLTLARAEHGPGPETTAVSLDVLAEAVLATQERDLRDRRIDLRTNLEVARTTGNATLLTRMLENLIENAIRHNQHGGWIRLGTASRDRVVRFTIESGGARIDPAEVAGLARPFRQIGRQRTQDGFGLGLSIVAAVATAHDGALELRARDEGGLLAEVTLPADALRGAGAS